jgi:hypothetical protein
MMPYMVSTCTHGLPMQEEERERRLDFVPEESALQTSAIEVSYCAHLTQQ